MRSLIKMLVISLFFLSMASLLGCAPIIESTDERLLSDTAAVEVNTDTINELPPDNSAVAEMIEDDDPMEDQLFYGVWKLEKVALVSWIYREDAPEMGINPYDTEDYLGYEFEYRQDFFRRGDDVCNDPQYDLDTMTVEWFMESNKFHRRNTLLWDSERLSDPLYDSSKNTYYPHFDSFIEGEEIKIDGWDEHFYKTPLLRVDIEFDELLRFYNIPGEVQAKLDENPHLEKYVNPVGMDILLLNEDTMLIGTWGKIILARRVAD